MPKIYSEEEKKTIIEKLKREANFSCPAESEIRNIPVMTKRSVIPWRSWLTEWHLWTRMNLFLVKCNLAINYENKIFLFRPYGLDRPFGL